MLAYLNNGEKKMKSLKYYLLLLFVISLTPCFSATSDISPVGLWKAYDMKHTPRSIIQIAIYHGKLVGKVVKILSTNTINAAEVSKKSWHGKPLIGLTVIWDLTPANGLWGNGWVLDLDNNHVYHCQLSVSADNRILHFTPYLGTPLLGPTINWERVK